jgi:hypothetical protein
LFWKICLIPFILSFSVSFHQPQMPRKRKVCQDLLIHSLTYVNWFSKLFYFSITCFYQLSHASFAPFASSEHDNKQETLALVDEPRCCLFPTFFIEFFLTSPNLLMFLV